MSQSVPSALTIGIIENCREVNGPGSEDTLRSMLSQTHTDHDLPDYMEHQKT